MENKEIQEINVEKELPKTLEEYVIKEIESFKNTNAELVKALGISRTLNYKQNEEVLEWKNKYNELVNRLKEDLQPKIATVKNGDVLIEFARWTHFKEYSKTQYEFYKDLFDLKEEGEEDNE